MLSGIKTESESAIVLVTTTFDGGRATIVLFTAVRTKSRVTRAIFRIFNLLIFELFLRFGTGPRTQLIVFSLSSGDSVQNISHERTFLLGTLVLTRREFE